MTRYKVQIHFTDRERADLEIFAPTEKEALKTAAATIPRELRDKVLSYVAHESYQNNFDPK